MADDASGFAPGATPRPHRGRAAADEPGGRLGALLAPFGDELAYSLVARTKVLLGASGNHTIRREAFGSTTNYVSPCLPGNLSAMASWLPRGSGVDVETLIWKHTAFPYYAPFLSREQTHVALQGLAQGWKGGSVRSLGHLRSDVARHAHLSFCPSCAAEDAAVCGVAAWRRVHQLPGVFVCPRHGMRLRSSGVRNSAQSALLHCPGGPSASRTVPPSLDATLARGIAEASRWLLESANGPLDARSLAAALRRAIGQSGLTRRGKVDGAGLLGALVGRFGGSGLSALGCGLDLERPDHAWPVRMWRERRSGGASHPLRYLLVCEVIGVGIADLLHAAERSSAGPRSNGTKGALPPEAVARRRRPDRPARVAKHRACLEAALKGHPGLTRTAFQRAHKGAYLFLKEHDRAWFEEMVPRSRARYATADWDARDRAVEAHAAEAVRRIREAPGRPTRITRSSIAAELGLDRLLTKHIDRLPRCAALMSRAAETHRDLVMRRVVWAAAVFRASGAVPSWSDFAALVPIPDKAPGPLMRAARGAHAALRGTPSRAAAHGRDPMVEGAQQPSAPRRVIREHRQAGAASQAMDAWRTTGIRRARQRQSTNHHPEG